MPRLRNSVLLGTHDEISSIHVRRIVVLAKAGVGNQRVDPISAPGQITQNVVEYLLPSDLGRQDTLDVLHDENMRSVLHDDSQILSVEEVAMVILCFVVKLALVARTAYQRIRLAWRPSNEHPRFVRVDLACPDRPVQPGIALIFPQSQTESLFTGIAPCLLRLLIPVPEALIACRHGMLAIAQFKVRRRDIFTDPFQIPVEGAEAQRCVSRRFHLRRHGNLKGRMRRESLAQPPGACKKVYDFDGSRG